MNIVADMSREVIGLRAHGCKGVNIKTGSMDAFCKAIFRHLDVVHTSNTGFAGATFMGVKVEENLCIPANSAVIMDGDEIINIVYFD